MPQEMQSFGEWLGRRRKRLGYTQAGLAAQLNCSTILLRKIEAEERRPSEQLAASLANSLEIPSHLRAAFIKSARRLDLDAELQAESELIEPRKTANGHIPKHYLPAPLTTFIGREKESTELIDAVRRHRLVTLTGVAGTGKTRMALHVGESLLPDFADGVWFADLTAAENEASVLDEITKTLGVKAQGANDLQERLTDYVRNKRLLLLLDNFEHVLSAASAVSSLMKQAPALKALVTSREALQLYGESVYPIPPLSIPELWRKEDAISLSHYEAVALFVQRAKAAKPAFEFRDSNSAQVAEICVRLDGLPLAIELAAARVVQFSAEEILASLRSRLTSLSSELRDVPERQRTLRVALDWSYDLLEDATRKLFARLAIFTGGWTLEAAGKVCGEGMGTGPFAELMHSLVSKNLVQPQNRAPGEERFNMLESLQAYAMQKLVEAGEFNEMRSRHLDYFVELAARPNPALRGEDSHAWRRARANDAANIIAALHWSFDSGQIQKGARILAIPGFVWQKQSNQDFVHAYIQRALEQELELPPDVKGGLYYVAGVLAWSHGDLPQARDQELKALEVFRQINDRPRIVRVLSSLVNTTEKEPELYAQAIQWQAEAVAIAQSLDNPHLEATILLNFGQVARTNGDYSRARRSHRRALELAKAGGHQVYQSMALFNLSSLDRLSGAYAQSLEFARQGLQLTVELGWENMTGAGFIFVGCALAHLGKQENAVRLFGAGDALLEREGVPLEPPDQADYQRELAMIKEQMEPTRFVEVYDEGHRMSMDAAIACAQKD